MAAIYLNTSPTIYLDDETKNKNSANRPTIYLSKNRPSSQPLVNPFNAATQEFNRKYASTKTAPPKSAGLPVQQSLPYDRYGYQKLNSVENAPRGSYRNYLNYQEKANPVRNPPRAMTENDPSIGDMAKAVMDTITPATKIAQLVTYGLNQQAKMGQEAEAAKQEYFRKAQEGPLDFDEAMELAGKSYTGLLPELLKDRDPTTKDWITQHLEDNQRKGRELLMNGKSGPEQFFTDALISSGQLLGDAAAASVTGLPVSVYAGLTGGAQAGQQALDEGYSSDQAAAMMLGSGAISAGIESIGGFGGDLGEAVGKKLLNSGKVPQKIVNYVSKLSGNKLVELLGDAASEGGEEFLEYDLQRLYENLILDKDTPRDIKEQLYNTGIGAFAGGLYGAARQTTDFLSSKLDKESGLTAGEVQANSDPSEEKTLISLEEFKDTQAEVWRNVDYSDQQTKAQITSEVSDEMLSAGEYVELQDTDLEKFASYFPDLRSQKKAERIPVIRQKTAEVKSLLRNFLEQNFKGKPIELNLNGRILEAKLHDVGIKEVLEKITQTKAATIDKTGEIFSKAKYLYSTQDKAGNPNIYRWNYFYVPLKIGDDTFGVRIAVRDMKAVNESQVYNYGIKKEATLPGGPSGQNPIGTNGTSVASFNQNLSQMDSAVNPQSDFSPEELAQNKMLRVTATTFAPNEGPVRTSETDSHSPRNIEKSPTMADALSHPEPYVQTSSGQTSSAPTLPQPRNNVNATAGLPEAPKPHLPTPEELQANQARLAAQQENGLPYAPKPHLPTAEELANRTQQSYTVDNEITKGGEIDGGAGQQAVGADGGRGRYEGRDNSDADATGVEAVRKSLGDGFDAVREGGITRVETPKKRRTYEFREPREVDYTPQQRAVQQQAEKDGMTVLFSDGPIRRTVDGRTVMLEEGGLYLGRGKILLVGDGDSYRHELGHAIEEYAPEQYSQYIDTIQSCFNMSSPDAVPYLQTQIDRHKKFKPNFKDEDIWRELANTIFNDPSAGDWPMLFSDWDAVVTAAEQLEQNFRSYRTSSQAAATDVSTPGRYGPNTVGAAESRGRMSTEQLVEQYGALRPGEDPRGREVELPKETPEGKTSRFVQNAAESSAVDDEMVRQLKKEVEAGTFAYAPIRDKRAVENANYQIAQRGAEKVESEFFALLDSGRRVTKNDLALGECLIKEAAERGDAEAVMRLIAEVAALGSEMGQNVQALRLLKRLTPEGNLMSLQRAVNRMNNDLIEQGKKPIKIPPEAVQDILSQTTPDGIEQAKKRAVTKIAEQVPVSWVEKWNAWRYLAMLGNPRTHVRNLVGNAIFVPAVKLKNAIGAVIESAAGLPDRTKTLGRPDKALRDFAIQDFEANKEIIMGERKLNPSTEIMDSRRIFKNSLLERARTINGDLMEMEDAIFLKMHYVDALSRYMKANGITPGALNGNGELSKVALERARQYATTEAQKATYRDASATADAIYKFSRTNKATDLIIGGNLPFKNTPINVVKRGIEYSPIGLIKGLTYDLYQVKKGSKTANEAIDSISAGLSGTALAALGAFLASMGIVIGGADEDKKNGQFDRMQGHQNYALEIDGKSYTLDWAAPSSLPFFVGAEIWNQFKQSDGNLTPAQVINGLTNLLEPVVEMSMLQGVESSIKSVGYSDHPLSDFLLNSVTGYTSQAVPTLFGQVARTIDPVRRSTYTSSGDSWPKLLSDPTQKAAAKIPFASTKLQPYVDQWGREQVNDNLASRAFQNFLSPGYYSEVEQTRVDEEVERLYETNGDSGVLPGYAPKYFYVDKKRVDLSADEYTELAKDKGQRAYKYLLDMIDTSAYKKLDDTEKANAVKRVYELALAQAKEKVSDYELEDEYEKIISAQKYDISPGTYIGIMVHVGKLEADKHIHGDSISGSKKKKVYEYINSLSLTYSQRMALMEALGYKM